MSSLSRFLPIIGVAVGGVLAMKVITSVGVLPDVFHKATAVAAEARPVKTAGKAAGEKNAADDPTEASALPGGAVAADGAAKDAAATAPAVAPVCATSLDELARDAGISPGEYKTLQDLGTRRQQLDAWQAQLNSQSQLIEAADGKLDSRIQQLTALKTQIQALIDQAGKTQTDDTNRMIKVYEAMKPQAAAQVLTTMADEVRLPIAAGMKDRSLAAILAAMTPDAARELTEKLANRMKAANGLQQKLNTISQAAPANAGQAQEQAKAQAAADASSSASSSSAAPEKLAAADRPAKKSRPRVRPAAARVKAGPPVKAAEAKPANAAQLAAAKSSTAGIPLLASKPAAVPAPAPATPTPAGNSK